MAMNYEEVIKHRKGPCVPWGSKYMGETNGRQDF
jgi:hypothetical protein